MKRVVLFVDALHLETSITDRILILAPYISLLYLDPNACAVKIIFERTPMKRTTCDKTVNDIRGGDPLSLLIFRFLFSPLSPLSACYFVGARDALFRRR